MSERREACEISASTCSHADVSSRSTPMAKEIWDLPQNVERESAFTIGGVGGRYSSRLLDL